MNNDTNTPEPEVEESINTKHILIIDDSKVIRDRLKSLLSDIESVEVVGEAVDVDSAIRLYDSTNPFFVVLDLRIPGGGGITVLKDIKRKSPATKVAVLTSFPYITYRMHCIESGADYFLNKSTEFEKIKSIVSSVIN